MNKLFFLLLFLGLISTSTANKLTLNEVGENYLETSEDFEGSWQSSSDKKYSLRMKVRVDQDDVIAYLYNDKDEEFMVTGLIEDDVASVVIRDANHFFVCNATITLSNGKLDIKTKGSPDTKTTHIPKEFSFTREY